MHFQGITNEIIIPSFAVAIVSGVASSVAAATNGPVALTAEVFATTTVANAAIQRSIAYVNERYELKQSTFLFLYAAKDAVVLTALTGSCVALDIIGVTGAGVLGTLGAAAVLFGMYKGISSLRSNDDGHLSEKSLREMKKMKKMIELMKGFQELQELQETRAKGEERFAAAQAKADAEMAENEKKIQELKAMVAQLTAASGAKAD